MGKRPPQPAPAPAPLPTADNSTLESQIIVLQKALAALEARVSVLEQIARERAFQ